MRRYRSHKVVEAARIHVVRHLPTGHISLLCDREPGWIDVGGSRFLRAEVGGYLVRYDDGSLSYSPAEPFEAGYREIVDGMPFGDSLELLKGGARIARAGWNGKDMWLALSGPLGGREIAAASFWSESNAAYAIARGGSANVLPCITMKTADGSILMGWLASQSDMLSDDWVVVP